MAVYRCLFDASSGCIHVKEAELFRLQGGEREPWGRDWFSVEAESVDEARRIAANRVRGADLLKRRLEKLRAAFAQMAQDTADGGWTDCLVSVYEDARSKGMDSSEALTAYFAGVAAVATVDGLRKAKQQFQEKAT